MNEENINPQEDECSYSHNQEEEKEDPSIDDNVHVLTKEDIDEMFAADEDQTFTVFEDDLPQIIAHSIKLAQKKIVEQYLHLFQLKEESEPEQENLQQYQRRKPNEEKSATPWRSKSLPLHPSQTIIRTAPQSNDIHVQRVCKELAKSTITILTIEYMHLTGC